MLKHNLQSSAVCNRRRTSGGRKSRQRLTVDVKGPGMKVFLRGYPEKDSTTFGADADTFQDYVRDPTGKFELPRGFKKQLKNYVWDTWMPAGDILRGQREVAGGSREKRFVFSFQEFTIPMLRSLKLNTEN